MKCGSWVGVTVGRCDPGVIDELSDDELYKERDVVSRIERVHAEHVATAVDLARRLAEEAAELTEDGIRDLVDEDDEADAAIQAAMVRQHSAQAMNAYRRAQALQKMGDAHAFGRTTNDDHEQMYVGRVSVIDGDDVLMVDWRAGAAAPFYRATPLERMAVRHRRHLHYDGGADSTTAELAGYSDEIFDLAALHLEPGLRGEAAILAAVSAPTEEQMRSVVATIQAEQDAIIRASSERPLLVQGGPGTGKTVVALHRAAYLLYNQRTALAETGVLIVGPTAEFLGYIGGVLPSLGESGVVSVTANQLYSGVLLGPEDGPGAAALKGSTEMVTLLAKAVRDRQRRPRVHLNVLYGANRARMTKDELGDLFDRAQRNRTHNAGAAAFRMSIIDALAAKVYDPAFADLDDARVTFRESARIRHFLLKHWPTLTPEQTLNDLFGSDGLLRHAGRAAGLSDAESASLSRERTGELDLDARRWTEADVPLLDELLWLLGPIDGDQIDSERHIERDAASEFEEADGDESWADDDLAEDPDAFGAQHESLWDLMEAEEAAEG